MAKHKSWALRITDAEKRGKFTSKEKGLANESWLSCAVGEKHAFPHVENFMSPQWFASKEYRLGLKFGTAVQDDRIASARLLYEEIMAL